MSSNLSSDAAFAKQQDMDAISRRVVPDGNTINKQQVTAAASNGSAPETIDDSLYSRQRYVLGEDAMAKLRKGKVAIFGLSGVGVEAAKSLILGGCGHVSLWDPNDINRFDLSQSFCFTEQEVGQPRAATAIPKLQELNPGCLVDELCSTTGTTEFDEKFMDNLRTTYDCVVVNGLDIGVERRMFINDYLRGELTSTSITSSAESQSAALNSNTAGAGRSPAAAEMSRQQSQQRGGGGVIGSTTRQKAFISADVFGVLGHVFVDLGNEFIVTDPGSMDQREVFFSHISESVPSTITTVERCHLSKGDFITLHGVPHAVLAQSRIKPDKSYAIIAARDIPASANEPNRFVTQLELNNTKPFPAGISAIAYFRQAPKPLKVRYRPLRAQLTAPTIRQCEFVNPHAHVEDHIAWVALMTYNKRYGRWPEPWDREDCARLATLAREQSLAFGIEQHIDRMFIKLTSCTCRAQLAPLASFIGAFAAQEAMKAITGKFIPLQQFLYVDFRDLVPKNAAVPSFRPKGDRYDGTRLIIGDGALKRIAQLQLFVVGAGAIGCELLKNLALIGFGTAGDAAGGGEGGCISLTDDDHIEKSNLNRQFLFRSQHITKAKSSTAAEQVQKLINPKVNIKPYQKRVQPASQQDEQDAVFNDDFLLQQAAVLFALDNRNTRTYLAQRCSANNVAHFDSGTLGELGHTFTVLPFVTEKYDNVRDPVDADESSGGSAIPYCTMKQFPYKFEHCIEWSRDKFHALFCEKPTIAQRCLSQLADPSITTNDAAVGATGASVAALLHAVRTAGADPFEGSVVLRQLLARPILTIDDCIRLARDKFYKYFELKAKRLLKAFPPDHMNEDGSQFWLAPKRAPEPVIFDGDTNPVHRLFIISYARLLAQVHNVSQQQQQQLQKFNSGDAENAWNYCRQALANHQTVEEPDNDAGDASSVDSAAAAAVYTAKTAAEKQQQKKQKIESTQQQQNSGSTTSNDNQVLITILETGLQSGRWQPNTILQFHSLQFEKDDDSNGHMDFVYSTANARAQMYRIQQADFLHVKRVAGRITPAIATTTACVAGLSCLELLRFVHEQAKINESLMSKSSSSAAANEESSGILRHFRNAQLNLGDASLLLFEPNAAPKRKIFAGLEVNSWDVWRVIEPTAAAGGSVGFTVTFVCQQLKERYNIELLSMIQGTRIIWMKDFPQFDSRELRQTDLSRMIKFSDKGYADVAIDCERPEEDDSSAPSAILPELPTLRLEKASAAAAAAAAAEAKRRVSTVSHLMSPRPGLAAAAPSSSSMASSSASTAAPSTSDATAMPSAIPAHVNSALPIRSTIM